MTLFGRAGFELLTWLLLVGHGSGFRRYIPGVGNYEPFQPYELGFVGYFGNASNYQRERVNEGAPDTSSQPNQWEDVHPRQVCPSMVGPVGGGKYYCRGREYGYCDRRSGTCFCNMGYQGVDCGECRPSHFKIGTLCYPKKLCPNDCNGRGECNATTGECICKGGYWGEDCGNLNCERFDPLCQTCTNATCLQCQTGFSVVPEGSPLPSQASDFARTYENRTCQPCARFDPRCLSCDAVQCTECADPLLSSSRRSGFRAIDPPLPFEEDTRQLSVVLPFGTQDFRAFDDAEMFSVVATSEEAALHHGLRAGARSCVQGMDLDPSWRCNATAVSHVVCGHRGTVGWSSPTYSVNESARHVAVTVERSGGGHKGFEITYSLTHLTTTPGDVTVTAFYTTDQTLRFDDGVLALTFYVTIHDDREYEGDEEFLLVLQETTGSSSEVELGLQYKTVVKIIDDDQPLTSGPDSRVWGDWDCVAGQTCNFTVESYSTAGTRQHSPGDEYFVEVDSPADEATGRLTPLRRCPVVDMGNGSHSSSYGLNAQGTHRLRAFLAVPGGLFGAYYDSAFLEDTTLSMRRVDPELNFTWGLGRVTQAGTDFVSVRWEGAVKPVHGLAAFSAANAGMIYRRGWDFDGDGWADDVGIGAGAGAIPRPGGGVGVEEYTFLVQADDSVRFWVDGLLLIDRWEVSMEGREASARVNLTAGALHRVVLEYRELRRDASLRLRWTSPSTPVQVVPAAQLYTLHEIGGGSAGAGESSPVGLRVVSTETHAGTSECAGEGLVRGMAGRTAHFTVTPRDEFLNLRNDDDPVVLSRDAFHATARLVEDVGTGMGIRDVPVDFVYVQEEAVFVGSYTPTISGRYQLHVALASGHDHDLDDGGGSASDTVPYYETANASLYGSPFTVSIAPAPTFAKRCRTWGRGLSEGTTGYLQSFTIVARDAMDNLRLVGGDDFTVVAYLNRGGASINRGAMDVDLDPASGDMREVVWGTVQDLGNGTYIGSLRPTKKGQYSLGVALGGVHIAEGPYDMFVAYDAPSAAASVVVGDGLHHARATFSSSFTFQARDSYNNDIEDGSWELEAQLSSPVRVNATCVNYNNGTARCDYTPTAAGENMLDILLNGEPVEGSPFTVSVADGPLVAATSHAFGPGLTSCVAGQETSFTIQARDVWKNKRSEVVSDLDGFNFSMQVLVPEDDGVDLEEQGVVFARRTREVTVSGKSTVLSQEEGLHEIRYNATARGVYNLTVTSRLSGEPIIGSPFTPYCAPTSASAALSTIWGDALRSQAVAGHRRRVFFHARDLYDNGATGGGEQLHVTYHLLEGSPNASVGPLFTIPQDAPKAAYRPAVQDRSNGRYDTDFVPIVTGDYSLRTVLCQPGGIEATYYRTVGFYDVIETRHDATIDFDWGFSTFNAPDPGLPDIRLDRNRTIPEDYWSARWVGFISPPVGAADREQVALEVAVGELSDAVALFIDGRQLLPATEDHQSFTAPSPFTLDAERAWDHERSRFAFGSDIPKIDLGEHELWGTDGQCSFQSQTCEDSRTSRARAASAAATGTLLHRTNLVFPRPGALHTIELLYAHSTGRAAVSLRWASASVASGSADPTASLATFEPIPVPASHFYRSLPLSEVDYPSRILPAPTHPRSSTAIGEGLRAATAGQVASFTVEARDEFGNLRLEGGDTVTAVGTGPGVAHFTADVDDLLDGTYRVSYYPLAAGVYSLSVAVGSTGLHRDAGYFNVEESLANSHIAESPFYVSVSEGPTSGRHSTAFGLGLLKTIAGEEATLSVVARDMHGNRRRVGGDKFIVRYEFPAPTDPVFWPVNVSAEAVAAQGREEGWIGAGNVEDMGDGTYQVSYSTTHSGPLEVHVHLEGTNGTLVSVAGSPFQAYSSPRYPMAALCTVKGRGNRYAYTNRSVDFKILTADQYGNSLDRGGAEFYVAVLGSGLVRSVAQDQGDGTYQVAYTPPARLAGGEVTPRQTPFGEMNASLEVLLALPAVTGATSPGNGGGGGLLGEYYDNPSLSGTPVLQRVDPRVFFDWTKPGLDSAEAITLTKGRDVSIRWTGLLKAPVSDTFAFKLAADDSARLYLDDRLVASTALDDASQSIGENPLVAGTLYKIRVEYIQREGAASISLQWQSARTPPQLIPPFYLYPYAKPVRGSPFEVLVFDE